MTWRAHSWSRNELFKEAPTRMPADARSTICNRERENCKSKANSENSANSAGPPKRNPNRLLHTVESGPVPSRFLKISKTGFSSTQQTRRRETWPRLSSTMGEESCSSSDERQGRWLGRMINHNYQDRWSPWLFTLSMHYHLSQPFTFINSSRWSGETRSQPCHLSCQQGRFVSLLCKCVVRGRRRSTRWILALPVLLLNQKTLWR